MSAARSGRFRRLSGWLWASAAVFFWGVMFPVGDLLMKKGSMPPESVGFFRYVLAFPPLFLAGAAASGWRSMVPHGPREWFETAVLGLIGSAAMADLLFAAQRSVSSVNASLLEAYVPMQVMALSFLGGAPVTRRRVASVALGFAGCMLVLKAVDASGIRLAALSRGDALVFLSGLCWAVYTALGRGPSRRMGGPAFTVWTVFFGAFWLFVRGAAAGALPAPPATLLEWKCILFLALFPTGISFLGWNQAQKSLSLAQLGFMEYVPPVVAAATAACAFGEAVTPLQWLGMAIVLLSAKILD
ncbi:MAG: DMT family transporter [Kiritimatiellae bacterium]|nr:DMT family transporter [Kiritimatiellia bacterium]